MTIDLASKEHYRVAQIPKWKRVGDRKVINGARTLHIPNPELMAEQRQIMHLLIDLKVPPSKNAHAYVLGRDILSMARPHIGKKYLIRIDIKDFFPSVRWTVLRPNLQYNRVPSIVVDKIRRLAFLNSGLPQGAPTSPILSNIALARFDASVRTLLKRWHKRPEDMAKGVFRSEPIEYTRYADDLIFSSNYPNLFRLVKSIKALLTSFGFTLNTNKVFCLSQPHRMEVCGVVVNEKLSKSRGYRRELRSLLHRIIMDRSVLGQAKNYRGKYFEINFASLRSRVAHVLYVCESQGLPLQALFTIAQEVHTQPKSMWSEQAQNYVARYTKNPDNAGRSHDGAGCDSSQHDSIQRLHSTAEV